MGEINYTTNSDSPLFNHDSGKTQQTASSNVQEPQIDSPLFNHDSAETQQTASSNGQEPQIDSPLYHGEKSVENQQASNSTEQSSQTDPLSQEKLNQVLGENTGETQQTTSSNEQEPQIDNSTEQSSQNNANESTETTTSVTEQNTYKIERGDTLSEIANKNNQAGGVFMSVEALALLNGIENPNKIYAGDELILTADKATVEDCNSKILSFISALTNLKEMVSKLQPENITNDEGGALTSRLETLKSNVETNFTTIIEDANAYSKWLSELIIALDDTELWATNVISSDIMFNQTKGI